MNIGDFDSPVSQQYAIQFVPNFKVYDAAGQLKAEGREATNWVRAELQQRQTLEQMGLEKQ